MVGPIPRGFRNNHTQSCIFHDDENVNLWTEVAENRIQRCALVNSHELLSSITTGNFLTS
jgi:hypothetical protein